MPITAQPLLQARDTLVSFLRDKQQLVGQLREQGQKIVDLEQEVQRLANVLIDTQNQLGNARAEIDGLRAQLPDEATYRAFDALLSFMASTESTDQIELRGRRRLNGLTE